MNSVALPASASSPSALGAEADIVRLAARGDAESFAELYRRHSQPAWRLAQAVASDREAAIDAFRTGFVRALAVHRLPRRDAESTFRTSVLAAVYKAAADAGERPASAGTRRPAANADVALADAAFRSLPDRWRAAVWLSEVENLEVDRIAPVLGVSAAVATQLVARGRRALAGRFSQAHREVPDLFGPVLRPVAVAVPANLADMAQARWSAAGSERDPVLAPFAAWLEEKAVRPMTVAIGALIGLGLIGLGVVPQGSALRAQLGASGTRGLGGAVPAQTCFGLACPSGSNTAGSASALGPNAGFVAPLGSGGSGSGGGVLTGSSATSGPTASPTSPAVPSSPASPGGGGSTGQQTAGNGPGTTPPPPKPLISTPVLNVSATGSTLGVTLLPSSSGGAATATVGGSSGPVCVTAGQTSLGCTTSTPTATKQSSTSSTATPTISSTVQGVTSTVSGTGL